MKPVFDADSHAIMLHRPRAHASELMSSVTNKVFSFRAPDDQACLFFRCSSHALCDQPSGRCRTTSSLATTSRGAECVPLLELLATAE